MGTVVKAGSAPSFNLVRAHSRKAAPEVAAGTTTLATSRGLPWHGVVAESGYSPDWTGDEFAVAGHLVGVNVGDAPITVERKGPRGFVSEQVRPGGLWILPAFAPTSVRSRSIWWSAVELSPACVRRAVGRDVEPRTAFGVEDEQLAAMVRALIVEARTRGASGPLFADCVAMALAARLSRLSGVPEAATAPSGVLTSRRLCDVVDKIESSLADGITVDELAAVVGLSPAHFAREFKRCMRESPHAFVLRRKLEHAQRMLGAGKTICETAVECGFTDQAHLSRAFKKRFGITPGSFVRTARGRVVALS